MQEGQSKISDSQPLFSQKKPNSIRYAKYAEFERASLELLESSPKKTRVCVNYRPSTRTMKLRATDDVKCIKFYMNDGMFEDEADGQVLMARWQMKMSMQMLGVSQPSPAAVKAQSNNSSGNTGGGKKKKGKK